LKHLFFFPYPSLKMRSCVLFTLLSIACGSRLRTPADVKLQPDAEQGCLLTDAPKGSFNNALALLLPDDDDAAKFLADAEKTEDASKTPTADEKKEWKAAMEEYVKTQQKNEEVSGQAHEGHVEHAPGPCG
jgi:hypothetical protein